MDIVTIEVFVLDMSCSVFIKCKKNMSVSKVISVVCERHGLNPNNVYLSYDLISIVDPPTQIGHFNSKTCFTIKKQNSVDTIDNHIDIL